MAGVQRREAPNLLPEPSAPYLGPSLATFSVLLLAHPTPAAQPAPAPGSPAVPGELYARAAHDHDLGRIVALGVSERVAAPGDGGHGRGRARARENLRLAGDTRRAPGPAARGGRLADERGLGG